MPSDNRVVRNVVAAIATAGSIAGAILAVSAQEQRDVTPDTHGAIFAADEVLRGMAMDEAAIVDEVKRRTGADVAPDGAVIADVVRAAHAKERDPRTLRSVALTMPTPVADATGFDAVWGAIYCDPLAPVKAEPATLYDACVAQQVGSGAAVVSGRWDAGWPRHAHPGTSPARPAARSASAGVASGVGGVPV